MKGHRARLITAVLLLPVLFWIVRYGPGQVFFLLVATGILIGQFEFYRFYDPTARLRAKAPGLALGLLLALAFYLDGLPTARPAFPVIVTAIAIGVMWLALFTARDLRTALTDAAVMLLGVSYVSLLLSHLLPMRALQQGPQLVVYVMGITWLADAGGYYAGSLAGRTALAPRISPNKTVEGAVGGVVLGVLGSIGAKLWFLEHFTLAESVFAGLLLSTVGQMGDLVESLWKRSAGVKDSGRLVLAHGGILDKVDSLIMTGPVFYYYLVLVKQWPGPS